jgi:hypothetical protein
VLEGKHAALERGAMGLGVAEREMEPPSIEEVRHRAFAVRATETAEPAQG